MTNKEEIYVGLDVGTSKITCIIAKREPEGHLTIIGFGSVGSTGIKKGMVAEIEEVVSGISDAVEIAERMAGVDVSSASINVGGATIDSLNSNGFVAVGRADQSIVYEDIQRAESASYAVQIHPNKEILHVFSRFFKVDDQEGIKDPVGMNGIRLEVETHIVTVGIQSLKNLKKVMTQVGMQASDTIASPLAAAKAVLKKNQKDLGCVVVDIGASTTGIAVFEGGEILFTKIIPIGGMHITNDIAIGLRTSIDIAEKVKIKYGNAQKKVTTEKGKIDLSAIDISEEGEVSQRHVAEIIEARVEEILKMVGESLKSINKEDLPLPAGVILTGGASKLKGIEEKAKEILKLPAELGSPQGFLGLSEKVRDPMYSVAAGLVLYSFDEHLEAKEKRVIGGSLEKIIASVKRIFKSLLP